MLNIDAAQNNLEQIVEYFGEHSDRILSEEDVKISIINDMLMKVLGWPKEAIRAEKHHPSGYSDYLIGSSQNSEMVVEAKRLKRFELKVVEKARLRVLKLSGNPLREADEAIRQVRQYADDEGVPLCVVTDGDAWIVFKTHVSGMNYRDAQAFVFPSLKAVEAHFAEFFDLLSRIQVAKRIYTQSFDEIHNNRVLLDQKLYAAFPEEQIRINKKPQMSFDLDRVFDNYFGRMRGDDDPELLIQCFVETRESRIADFSLEKVTANVLGNIDPESRDIDERLSAVVANTMDVDEGETIFIVGPTGSGKTTFVDRFFRKTLDATLRNQCVDVRVNCLDSSGAEEAIVPWMIDQIIELIEKRLFPDGYPSFEDLRGMYFGEYKRQSQGTHEALYKRDPEAFKVRFGDYLERAVVDDREGYLKRLLSDIVRNRKKLPVLIIDNIDEFGQPQKAAVFQLAQALRRYAKHALVIFPITDKSAWSFSKSDIFGIYASKSFFLPTPSPRDVFRKRIEYLKSKIDETGKDSQAAEYFSKKGIRISIEDLSGFAGILDDIFVSDEFTSKTLGELSNYNIRRTLLLARRVITSPVFGVDELVASYISGQPISTDYNRLLNALLKGDYELFRQSDRHEVFPIFQVDNRFRQSPLLSLRVLALLEAISQGGRGIEDKHASVQSIYDFFDTLGIAESALTASLNALLSSRLIEPFDMSAAELSSDQQVAITHAGRAHLGLATTSNVFFEQAALTTGITNEAVGEQIRATYRRRGGILERLNEVRAIFSDYLVQEDEMFLNLPSDSNRYEHQRAITNRILAFSPGTPNTTDEEPSRQSRRWQKMVGVVDQFNKTNGYGFVEVSGISGGVFVHVETVRASGFEELSDGDDLVCDVGRTAKGLAVTHIHSIRTDQDSLETAVCSVVRVFPDRGYGFVRIEGTTRDAFFHFSALSTADLADLKVGSRLEAELKTNADGTSMQLRRVLRFVDEVRA